MLAYLFPGQGSQSRGMGSDLFPLFPAICQQADEILGYSIKALCLEDPRQELYQTQYTQPALYVVNALSYYKMREEGLDVDFTLGHSLGEYNALLAAGVFDFETGLKIVSQRSKLMQEVAGGKMAAIIGLEKQAVAEILAENNITTITIANENAPKQFVISGPENDVLQSETFFKKQKAIFVPLKVSGAFHSPYMAGAAKKFQTFLQGFTFNPPQIPVIANCNALPYHPAVTQTNLSQHLASPVLWTKSIAYVQAQGNITFKEIGPGNILTKLLQ